MRISDEIIISNNKKYFLKRKLMGKNKDIAISTMYPYKITDKQNNPVKATKEEIVMALNKESENIGRPFNLSL